jgi:hypothetical protein
MFREGGVRVNSKGGILATHCGERVVEEEEPLSLDPVMMMLNAHCSLPVSCPPRSLDNRYLHENQLTSLDMGLFDKNTALTELYVDHQGRELG